MTEINQFDDTICAIATAPGEGGIGIVRISGPNALATARKIFSGKRELEPNRMTYGHVINPESKETIDEVMSVYMKAPHSYTAEDVVEIQCHGSIVSLRKILYLCLSNGARIAEPGEFTKRAFLNGRLDLTQAEAVIDLIRAKTDKSFDVALGQLEGKLSERIHEIRRELVDVLVNVTVNIDYPDEDIEVMTYEKLVSDLEKVKEKVGLLIDTSDTGRILRDGLKVSIIGKPNVGKSSLMNAILNESRAIVTSIPGTTRDTIEESVSVRSIPLILTDTAGIRETDDEIERIGIEKSKKAFNEADLAILMLDQSTGITPEDEIIIDIASDRKTIALLNKKDLGNKIDKNILKDKLPDAIFVDISAKDGEGIDKLYDAIEDLVYCGKVSREESAVVTNQRHKSLLESAFNSLKDALDGAINAQPLEFLEIDINSAYTDLGLIIGEEVEEDIINEVFSRFCLGK